MGGYESTEAKKPAVPVVSKPNSDEYDKYMASYMSPYKMGMREHYAEKWERERERQYVEQYEQRLAQQREEREKERLELANADRRERMLLQRKEREDEQLERVKKHLARSRATPSNNSNVPQFECSSCQSYLPRSDFSQSQMRKAEARRCKKCVEDALATQVNMSTTSHLASQSYYCNACEVEKPGSQFSRNQLNRVEHRRCISCVGQYHTAGGFVLTQSTHFAEGASRYAYKAIDKASGELVVVKQFKRLHPTERIFWDADIKTHQLAKSLVEKWNVINHTTKTYEITSPTRAYMNFVDDRQVFVKGEWVLVEKFIEGQWEKFNSNSGWVGNALTSVQSFCHWTYHYSNGSYLFCDAQGVRNSVGYYLTDPCIMSVTQEYGITDLGRDGIINWFTRHKCNQFCQKHWIVPQEMHWQKEKFKFFVVEKSTSYRREFTATAEGNDDEYCENVDDDYDYEQDY